MDAVTKIIGRNLVSRLIKENEQADAGRNGRTRLARPNSQAANVDREILISQFS